jgi:hypothetical protein
VLDHSCQVQRHPLAERGDDLYETPPVAVEALLRVEKIPHRVWEPACGPGNIVKVLRTAGHEVLASDLVDYGDPTPLLPPRLSDGAAAAGPRGHRHQSAVQTGRGVRRARPARS